MPDRHADLPAVAQQAALIVAVYELMTATTAARLGGFPLDVTLRGKASVCPGLAMQLEAELGELKRLLRAYPEATLPDGSQ